MVQKINKPQTFTFYFLACKIIECFTENFRGSDKSVMVKLHGKKNIESFGSFNGIPITCRFLMEFFYTNDEIIAVCHVHVSVT